MVARYCFNGGGYFERVFVFMHNTLELKVNHLGIAALFKVAVAVLSCTAPML